MTTNPHTRSTTVQLAAALLTALAIGLALAQDAPARDATAVNVVTDDHGTYLVDGLGMALYLFTPDAQGASTCYDDCIENWPAVIVESADALPLAGDGAMPELFGTAERDDGTLQLTYDGWPLYYFAGDAEPGDTNGQGMVGAWYLVSPAGEAVGMP